jgi:hypothetical protein
VAVLRFLFVDLLGFFLAYDLLRIQELLLIRFFFWIHWRCFCLLVFWITFQSKQRPVF